jgi:predicted membrane GTPase involved in stress response
MITGISDVSIGDTVMSKETPIPLPPITVEVRSLSEHFSLLHELGLINSPVYEPSNSSPI